MLLSTYRPKRRHQPEPELSTTNLSEKDTISEGFWTIPDALSLVDIPWLEKIEADPAIRHRSVGLFSHYYTLWLFMMHNSINYIG